MKNKNTFKSTVMSSKLILLMAIAFATNFSWAQTVQEQEQIDQAAKYIQQLNRIKADEILGNLLAKNPNLSAAQYQAGLIDTYFNKDTEAMAHFKKVIDLNGPEMYNASYELSKFHIKKGENDAAVLLLNHVIEKDGANDKALYERAKIKNTKLDFLGAKEDLTAAILHNPSDFLYHYQRGIALIELQDYPNAIQDFDKVVANIKTTPELENGYFYRGYGYYLEGIDPKYKGHKALLHKALADYDMCISLDKKDEAAFYNRGEVNMELGHYVQSISDFKHAIILNPNNYDAHFNKAMCNYHFGEVSSAIKELEILLTLNPDYLDAYYTLGVWKTELGDTKKAIDLLTKVIEKQTDHPDAYLFRGYAYLDQKQEELACKDWEIANKLGDKEAGKNLEKYCK